MREAWVLLRRTVGDVICKSGAESAGAVLSLGAGGEKKVGAGAVLARAAGERLRWEAWMVFIWVAGAIVSGGAVISCGAGGGEVIGVDVLS